MKQEEDFAGPERGAIQSCSKKNQAPFQPPAISMQDGWCTTLTPRGLQWENNSCAYNSVFTVLLYLWRELSLTWEDGLVPIENGNLRRLFSGFSLAEEGSTFIEQARDDVRRVLHDQNPTDMLFGRYTSINAIFESILTSETATAVLTRA